MKEILEKYNQSHVLKFYDEIEDKQKLEKQISQIDFELLNKLYNSKEEIKRTKIEPIDYLVKENIDQEYFEKIGTEAIKQGKIAVCQMAGGQGTRLGHNAPKGTYILELDKPKSIFEIFAESLKEVNQKYNVNIPWYIMTSQENNDETVKFFEDNNYFGVEKITFFKQGKLPMLNHDGKLILEAKDQIKEAADGNGGIFEALYKNKILEDMKAKGIEWLSIGNVDNILLKLVDEVLIGMAIDKKVKLAMKSVSKVGPEEKVGSLCKIDGKPGVVEYTEISSQMANLRDEKGNLVYGESYYGMCMLNIELLEKIGTEKLPYHAANKKCNYINEEGIEVIAKEPNAYKYEAFIFDAFKYTDAAVVLSVKREEEFAPVKNKEGVDSPETARKLYLNYHKKEAAV